MENVSACIYQKAEPETRRSLHMVYLVKWSQGAEMGDKKGRPISPVCSVSLVTCEPLKLGMPRKGKRGAFIQLFL